MKKNLFVSFFGSSGSGKSTCYKYAKSFLSAKGYTCHNLNVALPLRTIQFFAYCAFGKKCKNPLDPNFEQDGKLLGFLAQHFKERLSLIFEKGIKEHLHKNDNKKLAIINTDCRNNAYKTLKKLGFVFIKVEVSEKVLMDRRRERGDLTAFDHRSAVEQTNEIKEAYCISNDGTFEELKENIYKTLDKLV